MFNFAIGSKLPNGAIISALIKRNDGTFTVLAHWPDNGRRQWITWRCDHDGNCFLGHYFTNLVEAAADLQERCGSEEYAPDQFVIHSPSDKNIPF